MKRRDFAFVGLILIVTFATVILSTRQEAQQKSKLKDEPTVVQRGVMTEKQRRHSREFDDREIPKIERNENRDSGVYIDIGPGPLPDKSIINTVDDYLRALTCADKTDAIVTGKIVQKSSQLTENSRFVFTDYELKIREVLKRPSDMELTDGRQITITDPGGAVILDGRTIFAIISREQPLRVGDDYILFFAEAKGRRLI